MNASMAVVATRTLAAGRPDALADDGLMGSEAIKIL
jgi:hypothetical protein